MSDDPGAQALRKVLLRLVPFSMLLFFVQMMDKNNISYAALEMSPQLGFNQAVYGFAAGIFFLGAFLCEIPSNLVLLRVGARRWLARIMISWGAIVVCLAAVHTAQQFYWLRFLLGAAEAGLVPGVIYYLGTWIPAQRRGLATSGLMSVSALGTTIAAPLATGIMELRGWLGVSGWQWVFILEGAATVIIGFFALRFLPEHPGQVRWLSAGEQRWLTEAMGRELAAKERAGLTSFAAGFLDARVLIGLAIGFLLVFCNFATVFFLPQILQSYGGLTTMQIGLLAILPNALGGIAMIAFGRRSDRTGDRRWYLTGGTLFAALGFVVAARAPAHGLAFAGLCIAAMGILSTFGVFWAYAGDLLGGRAAAGGLAFINTASQLGGFLGPSAFGYLRKTSGNFSEGLLMLAAGALLTAIISLAVKARPATPRSASPGAVAERL